MAKSTWTQVTDELETCAKLLAVWIILKEGKMAGRLTARYSKTGATTFVTFQMFGWVSGNGENVYGHARMTGYGYDRTRCGIGEILSENREKLKECYEIELDGQDWNIQNTWEKDIEKAGYNVVRAI